MKKCSVCRTPFAPKYSSLQKTCSTSCAIEFGKLETEKKAKVDWSREKKERKEKLKSHGQLESELEGHVRALVRIIDKGCDCISCGLKLGGKNQAQAGHRFSSGGYNNLRYNLMNIFLQGVCCNKYLSGNVDGYDEGLNKVYGDEVFQEVKYGLRAKYPTIKLSRDEIAERIIIARNAVNALKKLDYTYTPEQRIALRRKYNKILKIYL